MDEQLFYMVQEAVKNLAVKEGVLMKEQDTYLKPETIKLVEEIQQHHLDIMIDQVLENGNKELFMQLTKKQEVN